jgi:hypothetical protein
VRATPVRGAVLSAPVDAVSSFARNDISQLYLTLTKGGYAEGRALTLARQKPLPRNVMEAHEQVVSTLPRDERFVFCLFGHVEGIDVLPRRCRPSAKPAFGAAACRRARAVDESA